MKFRAAVLDKVNQPMAIDVLEMAPLAATDVLIKLKASGLCHTDLEVIQGSLAYPLPIVLGHEGAGVVEAGRQGGHAGQGRRPRDLFLESALRALFLLRARPADS